MSDYSEHLISMAGGDGDPLDAIRARVATDRDEYATDQADQNIRDREALVAMVREQQARIDRVQDLHVLHEDSGKCAECTVSPYSMHSVKYPCPTISALDLKP